MNEELGLQWHDFGARNYDASLGRWMNLDPLAEQYTNITPYAFVANMPTIAVDPDGKRIIIVGNSDYRSAIMGALAVMGSTEEGYALLEEMITSKDDVIITDFANVNKNRKYHGKKGKNGNKQYWVNIDLKESEKNLEDGTPRSVAVSTAHELGHVRQEMKGKSLRQRFVATKESAERNIFADYDELENNHTENLVRAGLDMRLRNDYVPGLPLMNMQLTGKGVRVDSAVADEIKPKPKNMHFDYSSVPRASLNSFIKSMKLLSGSKTSITNNLSNYNHKKLDFKSEANKARIIE